METRQLGENGPEVPVICLGTWALGGAFSAVPEAQAIATVHAAIDVGLTLFDCAEGYGTSEALLGKAIKGRRREVFLTSKVSGSDHSPEHIDRALEDSLRALGTEYIDLYQVHGPSAQWPIEDTMGRLLRHRDAGKFRYLGVSNFSAEQTREALGYGDLQSSQPRYSMLFRDAEESVLPFCGDNGIGVLAYSVMAKGMLGGRYRPGHEFPEDDERHHWTQFHGHTFERTFEVTERLKIWAADHGRDLPQLAIAWVLANPAVTSALVGSRRPEQMRDNARAADWRLTPQDLKEIDEVQGDLRLHFHQEGPA